MTTVTVRRIGALGLALAIATTALGCSDTAREGRSPAYLILESLEAASGAEPEELESTLQSDVSTENSVFEDPAVATFRLAMRDVGAEGAPTTPTTNNFITLSRYRVEFRRTDGRNAQGVDVPYAFEGATTGTVGAAVAQVAFVIVRAQAKLEPPLANLTGGGQSITISTIADVTFFGKDQTGNDVSVRGSISVNFADWADPD